MGNQKLILAIFVILVWILPANGLVIRAGRDVVVESNEIIDDDLVAFANEIEIKGEVKGDLFAFGRSVKVSGNVLGTIYSGGASLYITPESCHSLWTFCGSLKSGGNINNLLFFGGELETTEGCVVKKDILAFGGRIDIRGDVLGVIKGNMGRFNLKGKINGGDIRANEIKIDSGATVAGRIILRSENEPLIDPDARIIGDTEYKKLDKAIKKERAKFPPGKILKILFFVSKIVIGIIIIALFRPYVKRTGEILVKSTWKSLGVGFLTMVVLPVSAVITLITIIGLPIAVFAVFTFLVLAYVSGIVFATGLGEWILKQVKKDIVVSHYLAFILGLILITLVSMVPYLGFLIRLLVIFFGTGMLVILIHKVWKESLKTLEVR